MKENYFTDDNGNRFNLDSDVYNPKEREVNSIIRRSIGHQLVNGTFLDY